MADHWNNYDFDIPMNESLAERAVELFEQYNDAAANEAASPWGTAGLKALAKEGFPTPFTVDATIAGLRVMAADDDNTDMELLEEFVRSLLQEFQEVGFTCPSFEFIYTRAHSARVYPGVFHVRRDPVPADAFGPDALQKLAEAGVTDIDALLALAKELANDAGHDEVARHEIVRAGDFEDEADLEEAVVDAEQDGDDAYFRASRLDSLSGRMRAAFGRPGSFKEPIPEDQSANTPKP